MASTHKHLRSSTTNKRPVASGLADGQLALNTASGTTALFFKDNAGTVVKVGPAHVGSVAPNATPAGSAGNSLGEFWVDQSTTTAGLKYYNGSSFVNLTPSGTTTTVGLVEVATNAETQAGSDSARVVSCAGLQSKVSDSISTTSSTTIASSTAVKAAYDLANAALPKAGGTITGEVVIGVSGSLVFEGSTDNSFETTFAVVDPTADRTITFPDFSGTVVTTGDIGSITSTMIANDTIVNADINSAAAIVDTKLATISTADKVSLSALNIDGATDIGAAIVDADLFIVDDGGAGTNRKAAVSRISDFVFNKISGDIAITSAGVVSIPSGTIVNADVNASAAIAGTKISPDFGNQQVITTSGATISGIAKARVFETIRTLSPTGTEKGFYEVNDGFIVANPDYYTSLSAERVRIDNYGRVAIGGAPMTSNLAFLQITGEAFYPENAGSIALRIGVNRASVTSTNTLLGDLSFAAKDVGFGAAIRGYSDGAWSSDTDTPGSLRFFTTTDGSGTLTEKAKLTNDGFLKARGKGSYWDSTGATHELGNDITDTPSAIVFSLPSSGTTRVLDLRSPDNDDNTSTFLRCIGGVTNRAIIYSDGDVWTSDAGTLTSDESLKRDISDVSPKLDDVMKLRVRNFYWTEDYHPEKQDKKLIGFIAQEFEEVFPGLVSEHKIQDKHPIVDGEGNATGEFTEEVWKKGIKEAKLVPILVKALQEAVERIETLEARLTEAGIA